MNNKINVNVKKLCEDAIVPTYATDGSGCFDLHALIEPSTDIKHFSAGDTIKIATGLSFEIPKGYVMLIYPRSGTAFKHDVRLSNCVGVIDSDYRGEVMVKLIRDTTVFNQFHRHEIKNGDRIAQGMIIPIPKVSFNVVDELSTTERGTGGFGSTGA